MTYLYGPGTAQMVVVPHHLAWAAGWGASISFIEAGVKSPFEEIQHDHIGPHVVRVVNGSVRHEYLFPAWLLESGGTIAGYKFRFMTVEDAAEAPTLFGYGIELPGSQYWLVPGNPARVYWRRIGEAEPGPWYETDRDKADDLIAGLFRLAEDMI